MPDETKPTDGTSTDPAQDPAGGSGGGQPPVADAGANAPPQADGAGAESEAEVAETEDEDLDPRLAEVKPTFTIDDAFARAVVAFSGGPAFTAHEEYLRIVFDRIASHGPMPTETAWRMLASEGMAISAWDDRLLRDELDLAVFVAVSRPLIDIAEAQQARFDALARELLGEDRLAEMRKRRAGRRARRKERISKRPEAMAKMKEIRLRNEAINRGETPPKVKPAAKAAPKKGRK